MSLLNYLASCLPSFVAWHTLQYFCGGFAAIAAFRFFWRLALPRKRHARKDGEKL